MSLSSDLNALFIRDLSRLKSELEQYRTIDDLWKKSEASRIAAEILVLHIVGNLRHFVGHVIGSSEYQRNRKHEFEGTGLSKKELLSLIDETSTEVEYALLSLSDENFKRHFRSK